MFLEVPVLVQFCAPAVTPWAYIRPNGEAEPTRNPGIRLIRYDRITGMPLEIVQYYLDFKRSNKVQRANWTVEYTMPKDYNMNDLTPQSFHQLLEKMKANGSNEFADYVRRSYIDGATDDVRVNSCTSMTCKAPFICSIGNPNVLSFNSCVDPSIPFGRK